MIKDNFLARLKTVNEQLKVEPIDQDYIRNGASDYIRINHQNHPEMPVGYMDLIGVNEELCELGKEISKWLRGKPDKFNLLEEMADVRIAIYTLQQVLGISDEELLSAMIVKIDQYDHTIKEDDKREESV